MTERMSRLVDRSQIGLGLNDDSRQTLAVDDSDQPLPNQIVCDDVRSAAKKTAWKASHMRSR
jgi:hypothetical protein